MKKKEESDFTSADSSQFNKDSIRKTSWSHSVDLNPKEDKGEPKPELKRTKSMKVIRTNKRFVNRKRRVKSVGRIQKVSK